ncbi:hypothetical protein COLO4_38596 [Corchorus olitorius]|uniref:Uncharacterized protein n=1 Tax=Corchorus olitorius TaxID=93759 RepID=A0A1R3FU11_9ROSI|nr:hypothetical protein COLO4_38596 [Corchorus olitorius]
MSLPPIVGSHRAGEIDSGDSMTKTSVDIPIVENCDTATVNVNDSVMETVDEPTAVENRVEVRRSRRERKQSKHFDGFETDLPPSIAPPQPAPSSANSMQYSRSLKAESVNPHSSRGSGLDGSQGSNRRGVLGASVSPAPRTRMANSGIQSRGSRSVPSKTSTGGIGGLRDHVDSMLLRGKQVARALTYEEASCEIISRMEARAVEQVPRLQGEVREGRKRGEHGHYGYPSRTESYGDRRELDNYKGNKAVTQGIVGRSDESSGETPSIAAAVLLEKNPTCSCSPSQVRRDISGPSMQYEIPSLGLPSLGPNPRDMGLAKGDMFSNNLGLEGTAVVGAKPVGDRNLQQVSQNVASNVESFDPSFPFVFGAGSSGARKVRKWKKAARVSERYSFDLLCHEPALRAGSKRSNGPMMMQEPSYEGSCVKRSRENAMEIETHGEVGQGSKTGVEVSTPWPTYKGTMDFMDYLVE